MLERLSETYLKMVFIWGGESLLVLKTHLTQVATGGISPYTSKPRMIWSPCDNNTDACQADFVTFEVLQPNLGSVAHTEWRSPVRVDLVGNDFRLAHTTCTVALAGSLPRLLSHLATIHAL